MICGVNICISELFPLKVCPFPISTGRHLSIFTILTLQTKDDKVQVIIVHI